MTDSDEFWSFFWEIRLRELEDLGKREAILATSKLVRSLGERPDQPVRLLELGCGEGQIIGVLVEAHVQLHSISDSLGVDYSPRAIEKCRHTFPEMSFQIGDFTDRDFMANLGFFEILLLVNALHEVFSASWSPKIGEVAVPAAKERVRQALAMAVEHLAPQGYLVLFDGLEPSANLDAAIRIRFRHWQARRRFDAFALEYRPFHIAYRQLEDPLCVALSQRDFTRYITKSIFLEKRLWQTERLESYQYFTQDEFQSVLKDLGLEISTLRTLTANYGKWQDEVEIETPGVEFPAEHILILAHKPGGFQDARAG
jgi:SAM-dependent methyltransferase